ncbi:inorganic pyrophosphatase, partial [Syncephalastrum racemosum]
RQIGALNTKDYELYLTNQDGTPMSFFHDVPLHPGGDENIFNMVVEIPKGNNAKLEIQKEIPLNPIKQKVKDSGKLKFISNLEGTTGYIGNYGSIPQTWEDPHKGSAAAHTSGGDNDPVDVVDISEIGGYPGEIKQVKLLGGLLMVDDGTTDWKLIALNVNDPHANQVNDIADLDKAWPDRLDKVKSWLKNYKVPQSGEQNTFAYDGQCKDSAFVKNMIKDSHDYWQNLVDGKTDPDDIQIINLTVEGSKNLTDANGQACKAVKPAKP